MAERKKRTSYYVGPKSRISREDLPSYEALGVYVAEVKKDGVWCLMTVTNGVVTKLESRTGLALSASMVGLRVATAGTGLLAGELVADMVDGDEGVEQRTGERRMHFFEALEWNGLDLRDLKLDERREALVMIFDTFSDGITDSLLYLVERRTEGFLTWYDEIMGGKALGSGAEGLVLKQRGTTGGCLRLGLPVWI